MACTQSKVERMAKKLVRVWTTGNANGWEQVDGSKTIPQLLNDDMKVNLFRQDLKLMMASSGCGNKHWPSAWRSLTLEQLVTRIR